MFSIYKFLCTRYALDANTVESLVHVPYGKLRCVLHGCAGRAGFSSVQQLLQGRRRGQLDQHGQPGSEEHRPQVDLGHEGWLRRGKEKWKWL